MKKVVVLIFWAIIGLVVGGALGGKIFLLILPRSDVVLDGMAGAMWVSSLFLSVIVGSILGLVVGLVGVYIFRQKALPPWLTIFYFL